MDAEENQQQVSHGAHSPWKSLRDSHIPTAATSNGKVENQKQVSHFPTAYGSCLTKTERRPGCGASLLLQAHRSIRKCLCPDASPRLCGDRELEPDNRIRTSADRPVMLT